MEENEAPGFFRRFRLIRVLEEGFKNLHASIRRGEQALEIRDQNLLNGYNVINGRLEWLHEHILIVEKIMSTNLPRLKQDMADVRASVDQLKAGVPDIIKKLDTLIDKANNPNSDETDLGDLATQAESIKADLQGLVANIGAAGVAVTITPATVVVAAGGNATFSANVPVTWHAEVGSINGDGVYTAPSDGTATDTVTATSQGDPNETATAKVQINAPVA